MRNCETCGQPLPDPIEVRDIGHIIEVRVVAPTDAAADCRALLAVEDAGWRPRKVIHNRLGTKDHYTVQVEVESVL